MPQLRRLNPELNSHGFFNIADSFLVFTREIYLSPMGGPLAVAGDVYPTTLKDSGEEVFLLNVTACYDCIDRSRTIYYGPSGRDESGADHGMGIKSAAFLPELIGDSWVFRVPGMRSAIFVASDGRGGGDDFYSLYRDSGMDELEFEQVWGAKGAAVQRWIPSQSPVDSGIQIVAADFTVTTKGDELECVQVSSRIGPNPNAKFDTYGIVPARRADAVKEVLVQEARTIEAFPSVLIISTDPDVERQDNAMIIGKRLRQEVARALLENAASLGIEKVFLSPVHHNFVIGPSEGMAECYPEITGSIERRLQMFAELS